jgi:hypothetical protein
LGDHGTFECPCPRIPDPANPPSCVLCSALGHTANYRGCPRAPHKPAGKPARANSSAPVPPVPSAPTAVPATTAFPPFPQSKQPNAWFKPTLTAPQAPFVAGQSHLPRPAPQATAPQPAPSAPSASHTPPSLSALEVSVCQLGMIGHPSLTIASCYLSPSKRLLKSDLEALFAMGTAVVLAGDFNSKHTLWSCSSTNVNGTSMSKFADELLFDLVVPLTPTYYPAVAGHNPNPLDVALLKNVTLPLRCGTSEERNAPVALFRGGSRFGLRPSTRDTPTWQRHRRHPHHQVGHRLTSLPDVGWS